MNQKTIMRAVLTAVLSLVATTATAHDFEVDGIFYKKNGDGTVSVTFKGSSYIYANTYTGDVVIPNPVTYSGTTYSVTSIGEDAFYGCSGLTSVSIPNSVTSIGYSAFVGCSGLTSVTIPNSVTSIGYQVFKGCSGLTSVTIGNSVTSIGNYAFNDCSGLTRVDISSIEAWLGIKFDGGESNPLYYAHHLYLNGEEVKDLVIPNSVTSIGNSAFYGCSGLTSVTIPNSVKSIGNYAFNDCSGLTSVTIPNSVKSIGDYAFYKCSGLTSVTIGNSVSYIDEYAFSGCSGLTSIKVNSENKTFDSRENCNAIIKTASNKLLYGCKNTIIPNSVTSIGSGAFYGCSSLTSVSIPNSVTSIGEYAFCGCSGLASITIPNSVTEIRERTFWGCSGLTNVTIPNSVTSIGGYAFLECRSLTSITIPNSVISIGEWSFECCSSLTSINIPNSVASIGEGAFEGCSSLTSVTIPNSVTEIGGWVFYGCSSLTSVTIPNSVSSIGEYAFINCSGLKSVTIPSSVTSIGKLAFSSCSSLTSVIIPNSVISIGEYAFQKCSGLTSVTIGNSVTSIGNWAFYDCSGLKTIFYNAENCDNLKESSYVFYLMTSDLKIIIGKNVKWLPNYLFYSLQSAPKRVILQSVTPPYSSSNTFNSNAYNAKLFVPSTSVADYKAAYVWKNFDIAIADKPITDIALSNTKVTISLCSTKQLTATATPSDATIADIFEWSSSNPEVAVVDGNGLVTAVAEGSTVIIAKALDGSEITASCEITVGTNEAENVAGLTEGTNRVNFAVQGVKIHDGVLYACTTAKSVNMSTPDFHSNDANNMAPYEDRNFADFDQRDWVAISGLEGDFEGKELSYPFVATFADGVLTPSETITATADATAYNLNTFRAENILHGGYSNYAEGDYTAYYVPARVNEVAKFMGLIETIGGVKYLYSNNSYGRKDGEGIKVEGTIEDNSEVYSILEGILVADKSTKAGMKIIMLKDLGQATGVEGVDSAAARIYSANGNIIIAAAEDGEAAVYDFTGRLIKSVTVVAGDNTAVPVMPGCYIVRTGVKTQSVVVK